MEADSVVEVDLYVAPNGTGDGLSASDPTDFVNALTEIQPGYSIKMQPGTYSFDETIVITENNAGAAGALKSVVADGGDVVLDFSDMELKSSNRCLVLDGSYWNIYGVTFKGAGDNGMLLSGDNNTVEMCVFTENRDTGLQVSRYQTSYDEIAEWPTNNLIKNCTSYNNCDAKGENADGSINTKGFLQVAKSSALAGLGADLSDANDAGESGSADTEDSASKIDVWDLAAEQLDTAKYNNKLTEDIINSWYPDTAAGTKGVNIASFQVKDADGNVEFGFNDGGYPATHRLRTMNANLTRYDDKNKSFGGVTYNGFIYSNKAASADVYIEMYANAGDIFTFAVSSNGTEADYVLEGPNGDKQTATYDAAEAGTLMTFYVTETGTY